MKKLSYEEVCERISEYYRELVFSMFSEEEGLLKYKQNVGDVIDMLLPYAESDNYWWEERSKKMAYYQMKHKLLVVDKEDFSYWYKELMGKDFNIEEFKDDKKRAKLIEESKYRYKNRVKN